VTQHILSTKVDAKHILDANIEAGSGFNKLRV
jgi:hypothetical protein